MFGSKLSSADYSGGSIFSLCCGFVGKRRKNSDDDVKAKGGDENDEEEEAEDPPVKSDEDSDKGSKIVKNGDVDIEQVELNVNGSIRSLTDDKDVVSDSDKKDNISENGDVETKAIENLLSVGIAKITKKDEEPPVTIIDSTDISKSDKEKGEDVEETIIKEDEPIQKNGDLKTKVDEIKSDDDEGKGTDDELIRKEKKVKDKSKKKGAAYQYEDASSSDSDDEVLKHYKENLVRSASMRSAKSGRTKASDAGVKHSSRGSVHDPELLMEQGEISSKLSYNAETDDGRHASPHVETPNSDSPSRGGSRTFENRAFTGDGPQSMSAESDQAQSTDQLNSDEHLFDVSDLQNEPPLISKCGSLEVSFRYDNANSRMVVVILQAREIPSKDRGGANSTQVRVMLLPNKKQRHKSKVKMGDNPVFGEKIYFNKILPDEIPNMGLRFRLYGLERMRRERMIGESIVGFASLNLDQETTHWVVLEPRSNLTQGDSGFDVSSLSRSDSASSTQSLQHGGMPELLLGLSYNGTTGRLSVEAIKGSNFRNMAMNRAPDTYVKISLMNSSGQEVQHCKTSVRRGQPNPLFKETFMLQVALFQLPDVTLMVSVYNKKSMKKKEMIGWFSLGMNSSGEEEASHWGDMRESKGEQVCRWHVLLES